MIVDTSALVAILNGEPEGPAFLARIREADVVRMSAGAYVEVGIVVERRGDPLLTRQVDELFQRLGITIESVTPDQARTARAAYRDFGKGLGHPAQLNFGDCFSYALAITLDEPLLFKGQDFSQTDVRPAIEPAA